MKNEDLGEWKWQSAREKIKNRQAIREKYGIQKPVREYEDYEDCEDYEVEEDSRTQTTQG